MMGERDHQRQQNKAHQRQLPVEIQHHPGIAQDQHRVFHHGHRSLGVSAEVLVVGARGGDTGGSFFL